jgi:hypothetical protein
MVVGADHRVAVLGADIVEAGFVLEEVFDARQQQVVGFVGRADGALPIASGVTGVESVKNDLVVQPVEVPG